MGQREGAAGGGAEQQHGSGGLRMPWACPHVQAGGGDSGGTAGTAVVSQAVSLPPPQPAPSSPPGVPKTGTPHRFPAPQPPAPSDGEGWPPPPPSPFPLPLWDLLGHPPPHVTISPGSCITPFLLPLSIGHPCRIPAGPFLLPKGLGKGIFLGISHPPASPPSSLPGPGIWIFLLEHPPLQSRAPPLPLSIPTARKSIINETPNPSPAPGHRPGTGQRWAESLLGNSGQGQKMAKPWQSLDTSPPPPKDIP